MADDRLEALLAEQERRRLAELERLQAEARRRREAQMVARPLPREEQPRPVFAPESELAEQRAERLQAAAEEAVAARGLQQVDRRAVVEQQRAELARLEAELERRRSRIVQPGIESPAVSTSARGFLPFSRPTRIVEEPARVVDMEGLSPLRPVEQERELQRRAIPEASLPAPFDIDKLPLRPKRVYVDPTTGERSDPTLFQELAEATQLQTLRTEQAFRSEEEQRAAMQREIDRRIDAGEDVPLSERILSPSALGILGKIEQGSGVVETGLSAGLRTFLNGISALAADAYFAGLGYEVDENGLPVDEDDFGFALAEWRRSQGIPDVISSRQTAADFAQYLAAGIGEATGQEISEEELKTIENLTLAVPHIVFPSPGVATTRTTRKATTYDPEGLRVVEDVEVPSLTSDPAGFLREETRRIAQNVAKGRTFGDEYLDTPAVADYYARVYDDPDSAYWAGMSLELLTPTIADAAKLVGYGGRGVIRLIEDAGIGATSRAKATRAINEADAAVDAARAANAPADQVAALQRRAEALRDVRDDYDPDILRRVSDRAVREAMPPNIEDAVLAALAREKPSTFAEAADTVRRAVPAEEADVLVPRFTRLLERNLPGDFVMITDNIGVPRSMATDTRRLVDERNRNLFVKPVRDMADDLLTATSTGSPQLQAAARGLYDDIARHIQSSTRTLYGYGDLPPALQRRLRTIIKQTDRNVERFDQAPPRTFTAADTPLQRELAKYDTWADVPADLRRQALAIADVKLLDQLPARARLSTDLTRLQTYFPTVENRFKPNIFNARLAASPLMRRLRASLPGRLETETLSAARAGREIDQAGRTILSREVLPKLTTAVKRNGSVDKALDELVSLEMRAAGEEPRTAWTVALGHLYGPQKENAIAKLTEDAVVDFSRDFPTVDTLRAVDRYLTSEASGFALGRPIPGVERLPFGIGRYLTPDYQSAMLKTLIEEGFRKQALISKTTTEGALRAAALERRLDDTTNSLVDIISLEERIAGERGISKPLPEYLSTSRGQRSAVYDQAASLAEQELAGSAEALFRMLDDVPVRARGDVARMAWDAVDLFLGTGRRNLTQRLQYGYIVPEIPQAGRLLMQGIIPFATIGARDAIGASQRMVSQILRRRMGGGGLRTPDGVYYSPRTIDRLADEYGIGVQQLETERVGSLASDLFREAKAATRGKIPGAVSQYANPLDRGFFLRVSDALERNFRRSVFEMELARGTTPAAAAERAREALLDYAATPDFVQKTLGRYLGESAFLYKLSGAAIKALADNPGMAERILRAFKIKAEAQDPYNIHGDKALKSLGLIDIGEDSYYLPDSKAFGVFDRGLLAARQADLFIDDLRFAYDQAKQIGDEDAGIAAISDAVLEAYDRFAEGEAYQTTDVPGASPMSDEKVFWSLAILANAQDPEHIPGGAWEKFEALTDPVLVPPPSSESAEDPNLWTTQPPEGTPHILWGYSENLDPLYYVFEPSEQGLRYIEIARALDAPGLLRALPVLAAAAQDRTVGETPKTIFAEDMLPRTVSGAIAETYLGKAPTVEEERRRQAEAIRGIREDIGE
jgi:hypothetical protein